MNAQVTTPIEGKTTKGATFRILLTWDGPAIVSARLEFDSFNGVGAVGVPLKPNGPYGDLYHALRMDETLTNELRAKVFMT